MKLAIGQKGFRWSRKKNAARRSDRGYDAAVVCWVQSRAHEKRATGALPGLYG